MLGTDYIETGEIATFQNLAVDTLTTRILNTRQSFHEQRPKVIGIQSSLPIIELSDVTTYNDIKNELVYFCTRPVTFSNTMNLLETSLNDQGLHFRSLTNNEYRIRYNSAYLAMEYTGPNHVFSKIPKVLLESTLLAVNDEQLATAFHVKNEFINFKASSNSFSGINSFIQIPYIDSVSLFSTITNQLITKAHLERQFTYFKLEESTFTKLIKFDVLPEMTSLYATTIGQAVSKAHLDRQFIYFKLEESTFTKLIKFDVLPEMTSLYASTNGQVVSKAHLDRELITFQSRALTLTSEIKFSTLPSIIFNSNTPDFGLFTPTYDYQFATKYYADKAFKTMYGNMNPVVKMGTVSSTTNGEVNYNFPVGFKYDYSASPIHVIATLVNPSASLLNGITTLYITNINLAYFRYQIKTTINGVTSNCESQVSVSFQATQFPF